MALKICPDCGSEVSGSARRCPKCQRYMGVDAGAGCLIMVVAAIVIFGIAWYMAGNLAKW